MNEEEFRDYEKDEKKTKNPSLKKGQMKSHLRQQDELKKLPSRNQSAKNQNVKQKRESRRNEKEILQPLMLRAPLNSTKI